MSQTQHKTEALDRASFFDLYKFASKSECVQIVIGVILTAIAGIAVPLFILISADVFDSMADAHEETVSDAWIRNKIARGFSRSEVKELEAEQTNSDNSYYYDATDTVQVMLIIGAICFLACWAGLVLFVRVGLAQANYYRRAYLSALLKRPISYYEYNLPGSVCSSIDTECTRIEVATGEKLFVFIYTCFFVIFGLGFACYAQMQLTLICLLQLPIGAFGASINVKGIALQAQLKTEVNKKSGGFLEECLIELPLAQALCAEDAISEKYKAILESPSKQMMTAGFLAGFGYGLLLSTSYLIAVVLYYSAAIMLDDKVENWVTGEETQEYQIFLVAGVITYTCSLVTSLPAYRP